MIIENERDRITAAWLEEHYTKDELIEAKKRLAGARRAYPSNIAKALGAKLPDFYTSPKDAQKRLKEIRQILISKSKS